jgi:trehalose/maltose hydrolase-like predicted phosphorylase
VVLSWTVNWFWPKLARQLVDYRYDRAEQARQNAADPVHFPFAGSAYTGNRTFKGMAFPWFSALTGIEQQPGNGAADIHAVSLAAILICSLNETPTIICLDRLGTTTRKY